MFSLERNDLNSQRPLMHAAYRTALLKLRALVGGGSALLAEDIVRTTMSATALVADPARRTELAARLMSLLIALGKAAPASPDRKRLSREVETVLDAIEQASGR